MAGDETSYTEARRGYLGRPEEGHNGERTMTVTVLIDPACVRA